MTDTTTTSRIRRTTTTTANRRAKRQPDAAGASPKNLERLHADEELAAAAGLSLPPPVYALGTPVVKVGEENFATKRAQWAERPAFGDVCCDAIARVRAEDRRNVEVRLSDLWMGQQGELLHVPQGAATDAPADRWLLTQPGLQGALLGMGLKGGTSYLMGAPADLRAQNFNYWSNAMARDEKGRDKVWSLRTRRCLDAAQQGQREVFAGTSSSYAALDADALTEVAASVVPDGARGELLYDGARFRLGASWFSDIQPTEVCAGEVFRAYMFLDTRDDGRGSIRVRYGVERNLCLNLIILGRAETKLSVRHAGNVGELRAEVERALQEASSAMRGFAERWTAARRDQILGEAQWRKVGTREIFRRLCEEDFVRAPGVKAEELAARLTRAWEQEPGFTRADLANAITRAAHTESWRSPWAAEQLEEQAGELLYARVAWASALEIE